MSVVYANLIDAMIGYLRSQPAITTAIGDDTSQDSTRKFWPYPGREGVQVPYAVYTDVMGDTEYMTQASGVSSAIETSVIRWLVVAPGKDLALSLAELIKHALNDAPLEFQGGQLMYLRAAGSPSMQLVSGLAVNCPNGYAYDIGFNVMVQTTT